MLSSAADDEALVFRVFASLATAALARCIGVDGRSGAAAERPAAGDVAEAGVADALKEVAGRTGGDVADGGAPATREEAAAGGAAGGGDAGGGDAGDGDAGDGDAGGGDAGEGASDKRAAPAVGDTDRPDCAAGMPSTMASTPSTSLKA